MSYKFRYTFLILEHVKHVSKYRKKIINLTRIGKCIHNSIGLVQGSMEFAGRVNCSKVSLVLHQFLSKLLTGSQIYISAEVTFAFAAVERCLSYWVWACPVFSAFLHPPHCQQGCFVAILYCFMSSEVKLELAKLWAAWRYSHFGIPALSRRGRHNHGKSSRWINHSPESALTKREGQAVGNYVGEGGGEELEATPFTAQSLWLQNVLVAESRPKITLMVTLKMHEKNGNWAKKWLNFSR